VPSGAEGAGAPTPRRPDAEWVRVQSGG